jgi:hypothetical protein
MRLFDCLAVLAASRRTRLRRRPTGECGVDARTAQGHPDTAISVLLFPEQAAPLLEQAAPRQRVVGERLPRGLPAVFAAGQPRDGFGLQGFGWRLLVWIALVWVRGRIAGPVAERLGAWRQPDVPRALCSEPRAGLRARSRVTHDWMPLPVLPGVGQSRTLFVARPERKRFGRALSRSRFRQNWVLRWSRRVRR